MASPTFRKVASGQGLRIAAPDWNAAMDAARLAMLTRGGAGEAIAPEHYQHAQAFNSLETVVGRHRVLAFSRPAVLPEDNLDAASSRLRVHGETPAAGDMDLAITLEAIPAGFLGRCAVSGVAICLVEIDDEDHTCAAAQAGVVPISSSRGPLKIIWKQAVEDRENEGFALCLVRIIGGRPAGEVFAVTVTIDGGSAGSASADCSWTYTVKDLDGTVIGSTMTPQLRRFPEVPYTTTPSDSPGEAYYDEDGVLRLFNANELPQVEEC